MTMVRSCWFDIGAPPALPISDQRSENSVGLDELVGAA